MYAENMMWRKRRKQNEIYTCFNGNCKLYAHQTRSARKCSHKKILIKYIGMIGWTGVRYGGTRKEMGS